MLMRTLLLSCCVLISGRLFPQNINCKLPELLSLDFFFDGTENEEVVWPESTVAEIRASLRDSVEEQIALQFLPLAMLEMNSYFKHGIDQEAFYKIIDYSSLFAETLNDSSWLIGIHDFCPATEQLINRFNAFYSNDSMMASLLYTTDRGPYFGTEFTIESLENIYVKDSIRFPGSGAKLYFGNYDDYNILYTTDNNGKPVSMHRILESYHQEDAIPLFGEVKCIEITDFGYSIILFVSDGVCRLYFDQNGRLRFYFIM